VGIRSALRVLENAEVPGLPGLAETGNRELHATQKVRRRGRRAAAHAHRDATRRQPDPGSDHPFDPVHELEGATHPRRKALAHKLGYHAERFYSTRPMCHVAPTATWNPGFRSAPGCAFVAKWCWPEPCNECFGVMTLVPISRAIYRAGIGLGFVAVYACVLNPQPLPPGDATQDGGATALADAAGPAVGANDAAGSIVDGATATPSDAGSSPPEGSEPDAGAEAGDAAAGDGDVGDVKASEADAPEDAEIDVVDAPTDAAATSEEGDR
jgi:hypothetical protein